MCLFLGTHWLRSMVILSIFTTGSNLSKRLWLTLVLKENVRWSSHHCQRKGRTQMNLKTRANRQYSILLFIFILHDIFVFRYFHFFQIGRSHFSVSWLLTFFYVQIEKWLAILDKKIWRFLGIEQTSSHLHGLKQPDKKLELLKVLLIQPVIRFKISNY